VLQASVANLDLGRAPYVLYGVKYIDLVSLDATRPVNLGCYFGLFARPFCNNIISVYRI
jgi:hypothetical protein